MKLAGVAWLDCGRSTQEFTCYMAGFAYPLRSHLRLDDQHAAQSPCLAILVPLGMWCRTRHRLPRPNHPLPLTPIHRKNDRLAPHRQQASSRIWRVATSPTRVLQAQITQRCTRYVAMHPLRRDAPDQKGCNAYGSGAPPPTTSPTAGTPSQHTTTGSIRRSHTASKYSRRFRARPAAPDPSRCTRYVAMHPLRRDAPDQKGCNAYRSGAPPLSNKPN